MFEKYAVRIKMQSIWPSLELEHAFSHSGLAQTQVTGTPCVWKLIFWSFLAKTEPDQAFASYVHGKFSPTALNFDYDFVLLVHFFGTPCIYFEKLGFWKSCQYR